MAVEVRSWGSVSGKEPRKHLQGNMEKISYFGKLFEIASVSR